MQSKIAQGNPLHDETLRGWLLFSLQRCADDLPDLAAVARVAGAARAAEAIKPVEGAVETVAVG